METTNKKPRKRGKNIFAQIADAIIKLAPYVIPFIKKK